MRSRTAKILSFGVGLFATALLIFTGARSGREQYLLWQLDAESIDVRREAAAELAELGSRRAIPYLIERLRGEMECFDRIKSAEDADWIREEPEALKADRNYMVLPVKCNAVFIEVHYAMEALVAIGEPAVHAMAAELARPENHWTQLQVSCGLCQIGKGAIAAAPTLASDEVLTSSNPFVARFSLATLGTVGAGARPWLPAIRAAEEAADSPILYPLYEPVIRAVELDQPLPDMERFKPARRSQLLAARRGGPAPQRGEREPARE